MPITVEHVDASFFELERGVTKFVNSCVIEASTSEVFALFEDEHAWPLW